MPLVLQADVCVQLPRAHADLPPHASGHETPERERPAEERGQGPQGQGEVGKSSKRYDPVLILDLARNLNLLGQNPVDVICNVV